MHLLTQAVAREAMSTLYTTLGVPNHMDILKSGCRKLKWAGRLRDSNLLKTAKKALENSAIPYSITWDNGIAIHIPNTEVLNEYRRTLAASARNQVSQDQNSVRIRKHQVKFLVELITTNAKMYGIKAKVRKGAEDTITIQVR